MEKEVQVPVEKIVEVEVEVVVEKPVYQERIIHEEVTVEANVDEVYEDNQFTEETKEVDDHELAREINIRKSDLESQTRENQQLRSKYE